MNNQTMCDNPSRRGYRLKCRCFGCKKAQADYMREYYRTQGGNRNRKAGVEAAYRARRGYTDAMRAADQRRRARKAGTQTESIRAVDVYDRDGWVCGICNLDVDPALTYPDPQSASLDHVIPLSHGGGHVLGNVRLAHWRCNIVRGNRVEAQAAS